VQLDVALCLPQEAESVTVIRAVITAALRTLGVTDECVEDIRLALTEACTNVIEHAAPDDEYEVQLQVDDSTCQIRVKNTGTGVDFGQLDGVMADTESEAGRGVAIMHAVMDRVDFTVESETGTIVSLVKDLTLEPDGALARLQR
jgi:serine/threonine-protein kinase RsbW